MLHHQEKKSELMMKKQFLLVLTLIFVSCGQENIGTDNTIDSSSSEVLNDQENSVDESTDSPFYDEVVTETEIDTEVEIEQQTDDEVEETTEPENEYVNFPGTIYRSKAGDIVFTDESGVVVRIDELSATAQSQLEEITFPQDSFEVNLKGERTLSSLIKQSSFADINTRVPGISVNYHFYVDSIELQNEVIHPERTEETSFSTVICGELSIDSHNVSESNLYSLLIKESSTSTTYVVTAEISDSSLTDLYTLEALIESVSSASNGVTNGCVYSNDSVYNDYTTTWRKLVNVKEYNINW